MQSLPVFHTSFLKLWQAGFVPRNHTDLFSFNLQFMCFLQTLVLIRDDSKHQDSVYILLCVCVLYPACNTMRFYLEVIPLKSGRPLSIRRNTCLSLKLTAALALGAVRALTPVDDSCTHRHKWKKQVWGQRCPMGSETFRCDVMMWWCCHQLLPGGWFWSNRAAWERCSLHQPLHTSMWSAGCGWPTLHHSMGLHMCGPWSLQIDAIGLQLVLIGSLLFPCSFFFRMCNTTYFASWCHYVMYFPAFASSLVVEERKERSA